MSKISKSISNDVKKTCDGIINSCVKLNISENARKSWERKPYYMQTSTPKTK